MNRPTEENLLAYVEGELDANGSAQVEQAMTVDPELRRLISAMIRDRDTLRRTPLVQAPAAIVARVKHAHQLNVLPPRTGTSNPAAKVAANAASRNGVKIASTIGAPSASGATGTRTYRMPSNDGISRYRWAKLSVMVAAAAMLAICFLVVIETLSDQKIIDLAANKAGTSGTGSNAPGQSAVAELPQVHRYPAPNAIPDPALGAENSHSGTTSLPPSLPLMVRRDPTESPVASAPTNSTLAGAPGTTSSSTTPGTTGATASAAQASANEAPEPTGWLDAEVYRQGALAMNGTPLQVVSSATIKSEDRINAWAKKNHATVLSSDDVDNNHGHQRNVVVELLPQQVTLLIHHLNAEETQTARLAPEMMSMSSRSALASPTISTSVDVSVKSSSSISSSTPAMSSRVAPGSTDKTSVTQATSLEPVKTETMKPIYLTIIITDR